MSAPGVPSPQAAPQGQPPSAGSSPVSQPVPNQGHQAAGMAKLAMIVRLMEQTIPMLGAGSEAGRDLLQATSRLAKHVSSGSVSQGSENTAVQNLAAQQRQMQPIIAQMRQGGQPPPQAGAAPPAQAA
jgi:hypothetical protein